MKKTKCLLAAALSFISLVIFASEPSVKVNVLNYIQAKTSVHFDRVLAQAGGINKFSHVREPVPINKQRIRRMNRDTLYSSAVIDISKGASFTLPDSGNRYMSATVINENHYINKIYHAAGTYTLSVDEFDTPYVLLTVRTLVNASDVKDIRKAIALQNKLLIESVSHTTYTHPLFDKKSLDETTQSLVKLAADIPDVVSTFGKKEEVNKVRHLLATAYGWGGLPESEVFYINVQPNKTVGTYSLTVKDVPVDGFWSISVYNSDGYFQANEYEAYSVNNLTADKNIDGSVTVHFGGNPNNSNFLPITEGWNYVVRMYRPRTEISDASWVFPEIMEIQKPTD